MNNHHGWVEGDNSMKNCCPHFLTPFWRIFNVGKQSGFEYDGLVIGNFARGEWLDMHDSYGKNLFNEYTRLEHMVGS
jgi:hypothetical protein